MTAAIVAVLTYFVTFAKSAAARTETLWDDKICAALETLVKSSEFLSLLEGWINPPKTAGHSARSFPMSYQAALGFPDGHRLRELIAKLHIDPAIMEKLWPLLAQLLVSLF